MVEQATVNRLVVGSSPTRRAKLYVWRFIVKIALIIGDFLI